MSWIAIFKTGKHTDSAGNTREWTEADLDTIVSKYQPGDHEAPAVIGHPKESNPAWGWVEAVKREGEYLFAKFKDFVPEFSEMLKKKMFKKISVSLYPDLSLRHVGFLGAAPPAVKGLPEFAFQEDDQAITIEFTEYRFPTIARVFMRLRSFLISKYDTETADNVIRDREIEDLFREPPEKPAGYFSDPPAKPDNSPKIKDKNMPTVEELQAQLNQKDKEIADFNQQIETLNQESKKGKEALASEQRKQRMKEHADFAEKLVSEGKLLPANKAGVLDLMEALHGVGEYEFSEADDKKVRKPALDVFKGFLEAQPKQIDFSEKVTGKDAAKGGPVVQQMEAKVQEKLKEKKDLSYSAAFSEVQRENPELATAYAAEFRQ